MTALCMILQSTANHNTEHILSGKYFFTHITASLLALDDTTTLDQDQLDEMLGGV